MLQSHLFVFVYAEKLSNIKSAQDRNEQQEHKTSHKSFNVERKANSCIIMILKYRGLYCINTS